MNLDSKAPIGDNTQSVVPNSSDQIYLATSTDADMVFGLGELGADLVPPHIEQVGKTSHTSNVSSKSVESILQVPRISVNAYGSRTPRNPRHVGIIAQTCFAFFPALCGIRSGSSYMEVRLLWKQHDTLRSMKGMTSSLKAKN